MKWWRTSWRICCRTINSRSRPPGLPKGSRPSSRPWRSPRSSVRTHRRSSATSSARSTQGPSVGVMPTDFMYAFSQNQQVVPARELLEWRGAESTASAGRFHLSSWLLYHWLWNQRGKQFTAYQKHLADGEDPDAPGGRRSGVRSCAAGDAGQPRRRARGVREVSAVRVLQGDDERLPEVHRGAPLIR